MRFVSMCICALAHATTSSATSKSPVYQTPLPVSVPFFVVPAGAACESRPGRGAGTPYFVDSEPGFQSALRALDAGDVTAPPLRALLDEARPRDALTLWHLLTRLPADTRGPLFDRLVGLAPPPPGVTRESVLSLDRTALQRWHDALPYPG